MSAQIRRDRWGVPHLRAGGVDALAYVQGRATALDRAWQLDIERRRSEGTLAEQVGPAELEWDRFARRARLDDTARRGFQALDGATRRWLTAYADGVNGALAAGARQAPEFEATGPPGRWQPWSSLGVFLVQHVLFSTFGHKLWRAHVVSTLGEPALDLLGRAPGVTAGSNAWLVTGEWTATGRPMIAADPHRLIEAPGVYQQVRLTCARFDVSGLAFPGVPGVQHFGHTGTVAWAVTNAMADYQDLYTERLRRDGERVLALGPAGWRPAWRRLERIGVRGGATEPVEVIETERGPVISGGPDRGEGLSLRTPSRVHADLGFATLLPLLAARTVADVERALRHWVEPVNSVLVADSTGGARRLLAGRVPVRAAANRIRPVPAWDPAHAWTGADEPLPGADVRGCQVAANDRRAGDNAALGYDFAPSHRADRIAALLAGRSALTAADLAAPALDTELGSAGVLLAVLAALPPGTASGRRDGDPGSGGPAPAPGGPATAPGGPGTANGGPGTAPGWRDGDPLATARDRLLRWDRRMDAGSTDAGLFAAWRLALVTALAGQDALRPLSAGHGHPRLFQPWLDPPARIGQCLEALVTSGDRLGLDVPAAARQALAQVAAAPVQTWGARHALAPVHVLGDVPGLPPTPLAGDEDCVLSTGSVPGRSDRCVRGPVARLVWDLADSSAGRWVVPLGASGRWGDPHALDQLPAWSGGLLLPVIPRPDELHLEETVPLDHRRDLDGSPLRGPGDHPPDVPGPAVRRPAVRDVTLTPLRPDADAELVHRWVRRPRARFWGMQDHSVDDVRDVYAFVDSLPTHHAFLIRLAGEPVGIFQTYDPAHDPVGECYPVQPGDVGVHLLLAPEQPVGPGFARALGLELGRHLFADATCRRVVAEPDAANDAALGLARRLGFTLGDEVDLPTKRARMAFLTAERFALLRDA